MADFQVVTHVPADSAHGGGCYLCKLDQRKNRQGELEPMIATHVEVEFEGQVVICQSCVLEQAYLFGASTPEQAAKDAAEIDDLNGRLQDAAEQLDAAQAANQAMLKDLHETIFGTPTIQTSKPKDAA